MDAPETHCQLWREWSDVANVASGTTGAYVINYTIYVVFAVLFAGLAGLYVTTLAPYASGSGIPEVWLQTITTVISILCVCRLRPF